MTTQRGIKVNQICMNCEGLFMVRKAEVNRGNGKYCSRTCKLEHQHKLGYYREHLAELNKKIDSIEC
jgi:hypothetical protein